MPELLERELAPAVDGFLSTHGVRRDDVEGFLLHPGGRRILDTIRDVLGLAESDLRLSRETLAEVGNLSSASLLWVLAKALEGGEPSGLTLLGAFGPGFNAELLLGRLG